MYVEAVGTLPPSGMSMLSVQMIPPFSGMPHLIFGSAEVERCRRTTPCSPRGRRWRAAARSRCRRTGGSGPQSWAFWITASARSNASSVTFAGSSPFSSMTRPSVSPIEFHTPTFPFSFGSSRSCVTVVTGPVSSSFHAIPSIPENQGSVYSRFGSKRRGCLRVDEVRDVRDEALVELLHPVVRRCTRRGSDRCRSTTMMSRPIP